MSRNSAYILIVSVLCLAALGLVALLSVSAFSPDNHGNAVFFITRQMIWLGMGLTLCVVLARVDYHIWVRHAWWIVGISGALLLACLVPGLGVMAKGARRWLDLGLFHIQPAEVAKLAVVIFLAYWLGKHQRLIGRFKQGFAVPIGVVLGIGSILLLQPDLGTAALLIVVAFLMMFIGGTKLRYILPFPVVGLMGILTMAFFMPERKGRLLAFLNPEQYRSDEGYQIWQALIAFGSGGVKGLGLGNSVQKMFYLPEAHTDFIFPIIGEELGLVVTLSVVFCFILLALAGGYISYHAPEPTGVMLGMGVTSLICLQAGLNFAVVTAMVPPKGIGLPFISYGGSNLVISLACVGILLNIHRQAHYELASNALLARVRTR